MKNTEIPSHLPHIKPAPDGYHWEYRGRKWVATNVMYAILNEQDGQWVYGNNIFKPCNAGGFPEYHYVELVKTSKENSLKEGCTVLLKCHSSYFECNVIKIADNGNAIKTNEGWRNVGPDGCYQIIEILEN